MATFIILTKFKGRGSFDRKEIADQQIVVNQENIAAVIPEIYLGGHIGAIVILTTGDKIHIEETVSKVSEILESTISEDLGEEY